MTNGIKSTIIQDIIKDVTLGEDVEKDSFYYEFDMTETLTQSLDQQRIKVEEFVRELQRLEMEKLIKERDDQINKLLD